MSRHVAALITGALIIWVGVANTTPGVLNAAPVVTFAGLILAVYALVNLVFDTTEDITEAHPDAFGSLDIREREGHE